MKVICNCGKTLRTFTYIYNHLYTSKQLKPAGRAEHSRTMQIMQNSTLLNYCELIRSSNSARKRGASRAFTSQGATWFSYHPRMRSAWSQRARCIWASPDKAHWTSQDSVAPVAPVAAVALWFPLDWSMIGNYSSTKKNICIIDLPQLYSKPLTTININKS